MASHTAVFPSKVSFSEATRNIAGTRKVAVTTSVHFAAAAAAAAAPQRKRNTQVVLVPAMASCMAVFPSKVSFSEAPRNIAGTRKVSATSSVHFAAAAAAAAAPQ